MMKQSRISLSQAATLALSGNRQPVLTAYDLGALVFNLYLEGTIQGQTLNVRRPIPERRHFREVKLFLTTYGVIKPLRGFPTGAAFTVLGQPDPSGPEIVCAIDKFAYLSHLSAMAIHGITDRIPHTFFVSSPPPKIWKASASTQMRKDLNENFDAYSEAGFPLLRRIQYQKILGQPVQMTRSIHLGAFKRLEPNGVRVSTIGRTFLDMLRQPELCGGMQHVIEVYEQHAKTYLSLITSEIDRHGADIEKVRAGYILEELCEIPIDQMTTWSTLSKRGGSQKLVAKNPYSSTFSEKWNLSLNIN